MSTRAGWCVLALFAAGHAYAQDHAEPAAPATASVPSANTAPPSTPTPPPERDVSLRIGKFASNFFSDQKKIWTFPAKVVTGTRLVPTLVVVGITAALVPADPPIGRFFVRNQSHFDGFNSVFSENHTTAFTLLTPAAFYGAGLLTRNSYHKRTGLLMAETYANIEIVDTALRNITRRVRPVDSPRGSRLDDTWFKGKASLQGESSFPSGHMAWAVGFATIIVRRYPEQKWLPYVAYGLAAVGFLSRLSTNAHYLSDNVFGSVVGYSIARYVVLRQ